MVRRRCSPFCGRGTTARRRIDHFESLREEVQRLPALQPFAAVPHVTYDGAAEPLRTVATQLVRAAGMRLKLHLADRAIPRARLRPACRRWPSPPRPPSRTGSPRAVQRRSCAPDGRGRARLVAAPPRESLRPPRARRRESRGDGPPPVRAAHPARPRGTGCTAASRQQCARMPRSRRSSRLMRP
eukprot:3712276-Prymnesium_polylepis.2